jgi:hypothetical protein
VLVWVLTWNPFAMRSSKVASGSKSPVSYFAPARPRARGPAPPISLSCRARSSPAAHRSPP